MPTATFTGGYGNLYGDYWQKTEKGWAARIPGQADLIEAICSPEEATEPHAGLFFVATELHAEHNAHLPLLAELGGRWGCNPGRGGNLLLHKPELEVLSSRDLLMPGKRYMTRWNVRHADTGVKWWIVGAHLIAGDGPQFDSLRSQQAQYIVDHTATLHRAILGADLNSASYNPGRPHAVLEAGGWRALRKASQRPVANAALDSHGETDRGVWIEGLFVKDLVTVDSAAGVPTNGLSDHTLWMRATFTITS